MKIVNTFLPGAALGLTLFVSSLPAGAIVAGSLANTLPNLADTSASPVNIGFSINFFGTSYTQLSVNQNGNITLSNPGGDSDYGLGNLNQTGFPVIAPFFADVDTSGAGTVTYGSLAVGGQQAFAVDWTNVGYYPSGADKLNSFQLLLIQNPGAGNFTIEFNYDQIKWESGLANGGIGGIGGGSAVAGYSSTGTTAGVTFQLPGSAVNGAFIDGGPNSLVAGQFNSRGNVAGRYDFNFQNGQLTPEPATPVLAALGLVSLALWMHKSKARKGRA